MVNARQLLLHALRGDKPDLTTSLEPAAFMPETLTGMLMLLLGRLPHTGDRVDFDGWNFEIVDLDGKRIDKVIASRLPETSGEATPDDPLTPARDVD